MLFSEPKIPQSEALARCVWALAVSVLFSEPKIPQFVRSVETLRGLLKVSVLFSEPKIPQCRASSASRSSSAGFSALQRAENSSMVTTALTQARALRFSALQRAENSSIDRYRAYCAARAVRFSEPKIPQSRPSHLRPSIFPTAMITLRHS